MPAFANPTLATVGKVQAVLEQAGGPMSRYELHKRLEGTVNYPVLEAALEHFTRLGVLDDGGPGGKVSWTGPGRNLESIRKRPVRELRAMVRRRHRDIISVARRHGASNVQLFGSVARGELNPSDIDLLVDYGPKVSLLDAIALQDELTDLLGFPVDVVQRAALSLSIRDGVLSEAEAL